ncbi:MAG: hypothetical protein C3F02_04115 [Parcubacteria group bacterium]|nr:MAG: hypothetical protein C3F02_04115 [Parcubacteria group bacterium]
MPKVNPVIAGKNTTPKAKPAKTADNLWEFEQFVSQSPQPISRRNSGPVVLLMLIIILILGALVIYTFKFKSSSVNSTQFKAVYLDNGQIYYAKVAKEDNLNIYLDDVYYVETREQTVTSTVSGQEVQQVSVPVLIKRTDAPYKPEGYLQINRQKVVAIEGLNSDSLILKEIDRLNKN